MIKALKVHEDSAGKRLDAYLATELGIPRNQISKLIDNDLVKVGAEIAKASYKLKPNDKIHVKERTIQDYPDLPDPKIIFEDENVIVLDKPAGMLTHSKGEYNHEKTVATYAANLVDSSITKTNRSGIVHRLDRLTSGVIIVAKNQSTLTYLQKQFSNRKTKKIYYAVVYGTPKNQEAVIDIPLGRNPKKPQTFIVSKSGRSAITKYKVIKSGTINGKNVSLIELRPETGRTHQIRVHLQHIGNPILGDVLYGKNDGFRLMLHAQSLELTIPGSQRKVFTSKLPKEFDI